MGSDEVQTSLRPEFVAVQFGFEQVVHPALERSLIEF